MKFFAFFAVLAILLVCMLAQQQHQANANIFRDIGHGFKDFGHDVAHVAVKAADGTAHIATEGADDVAKGVSTAAKATAKGVVIGAKAVGTAAEHSGPVIKTVDKVANQIEPVAQVIGTGLQIGQTIGQLAA